MSLTELQKLSSPRFQKMFECSILQALTSSCPFKHITSGISQESSHFGGIPMLASLLQPQKQIYLHVLEERCPLWQACDRK
mmetsp:Transcript_9757/g.21063  ORF Transcript_9757/g.21063 Transcript_9757/m.21063 type:complete len:81 (+) Transcript_9757:155-397(+)